MANLIPLRIYLQLEALAAFLIATVVYSTLQGSWWLYGALFFAPDLFMLGYLAGRRTGALAYNFGHTYLIPTLLIGFSWWMHSTGGIEVGLIWCAHIGFDRMLGYGLKCDSGFKDTHLQKL
jgi:hypothetical protein